MGRDWIAGYAKAAAIVAALKREAADQARDLVVDLTLAEPTTEAEAGRLAGYRDAVGVEADGEV